MQNTFNNIIFIRNHNAYTKNNKLILFLKNKIEFNFESKYKITSRKIKMQQIIIRFGQSIHKRQYLYIIIGLFEV